MEINLTNDEGAQCNLCKKHSRHYYAECTGYIVCRGCWPKCHACGAYLVNVQNHHINSFLDYQCSICEEIFCENCGDLSENDNGDMEFICLSCGF